MESSSLSPTGRVAEEWHSARRGCGDGCDHWHRGRRTDTIFDLAVSNDGKLLATAGGDKLVKIWDLGRTRKSRKLVRSRLAGAHASHLMRRRTQLVTGGTDQQIKVWT